MTRLNIYRYFYLLLISLCALSLPAKKQEKSDILIADHAPVFGGVAVSADVVGLFMKVANSRFSNMEAAARLNFREKYFPIVELGIGDCTKEGGENESRFSTTAPYFRVGMDYNFNKKMNGNRMFGGIRYGFSRYNYDYENPDFQDPVWGDEIPLYLKSMKGRNQWLELVVGVETRLWSIVRLGWDLRYKARLAQKVSDYGEPWYVPGYGRNVAPTFGGTVKLIFDVGKTAKNLKKKNEKK